MEMVLVVATALRFGEMRKLFPPGRYAFIRSESERETKMKIMDLSPSLVVVDMLLPSGKAKEIAIFASSQEIDTVLVVTEEMSGHMAAAMSAYGVYAASFSRESVVSVFGAVGVAREKIRKAEEKNRKLLMRLRNEKLLTEAKCLLAMKKSMSEAEAHCYIEKKAMNCRISLSDAAMSIVRELS